MKFSKTTSFATCLLALILPMHSSAQTVPLPGQWDVTNTALVFDEATQAFQPFMVQRGDSDTRSECLDAAYFQRMALDKPYFVTQQNDRPGLQCVVTNEAGTDSTNVWRQVCTDQDGFIEEGRYAVSLLSNAIEIESYSASKLPVSRGSKSTRQSKVFMRFKRTGDCN